MSLYILVHKVALPMLFTSKWQCIWPATLPAQASHARPPCCPVLKEKAVSTFKRITLERKKKASVLTDHANQDSVYQTKSPNLLILSLRWCSWFSQSCPLKWHRTSMLPERARNVILIRIISSFFSIDVQF
jgi:hypothetical protein